MKPRLFLIGCAVLLWVWSTRVKPAQQQPATGGVRG